MMTMVHISTDYLNFTHQIQFINTDRLITGRIINDSRPIQPPTHLLSDKRTNEQSNNKFLSVQHWLVSSNKLKNKYDDDDDL